MKRSETIIIESVLYQDLFLVLIHLLQKNMAQQK